MVFGLHLVNEGGKANQRATVQAFDQANTLLLFISLFRFFHYTVYTLFWIIIEVSSYFLPSTTAL